MENGPSPSFPENANRWVHICILCSYPCSDGSVDDESHVEPQVAEHHLEVPELGLEPALQVLDAAATEPLAHLANVLVLVVS